MRPLRRERIGLEYNNEKGLNDFNPRHPVDDGRES